MSRTTPTAARLMEAVAVRPDDVPLPWPASLGVIFGLAPDGRRVLLPAAWSPQDGFDTTGLLGCCVAEALLGGAFTLSVVQRDLPVGAAPIPCDAPVSIAPLAIDRQMDLLDRFEEAHDLLRPLSVELTDLPPSGVGVASALEVLTKLPGSGISPDIRSFLVSLACLPGEEERVVVSRPASAPDADVPPLDFLGATAMETLIGMIADGLIPAGIDAADASAALTLEIVSAVLGRRVDVLTAVNPQLYAALTHDVDAAFHAINRAADPGEPEDAGTSADVAPGGDTGASGGGHAGEDRYVDFLDPDDGPAASRRDRFADEPGAVAPPKEPDRTAAGVGTEAPWSGLPAERDPFEDARSQWVGHLPAPAYAADEDEDGPDGDAGATEFIPRSGEGHLPSTAARRIGRVLGEVMDGGHPPYITEYMRLRIVEMTLPSPLSVLGEAELETLEHVAMRLRELAYKALCEWTLTDASAAAADAYPTLSDLVDRAVMRGGAGTCSSDIVARHRLSQALSLPPGAERNQRIAGVYPHYPALLPAR